MNKEFSNFEEFLEDKFPSQANNIIKEDKVNIQEFIDKVTYQFSQRIEKIINK